MAGITNAAFRQICREYGGGLYVCEMITSRALVERNERTMRMIRFAPSESPRSLQLYGVDPVVVGEAIRMLVAEDRADHVDLNFGCPVPKVTRRGGGAALPYRRGLLRDILRAAVRAAEGRIPVTMKMRIGIDSTYTTFLDAGRIAEGEGIAAVALHGRTAAQMYGGHADWSAITTLKCTVDIPVLGNGDIWEAADALRMMAETGCDGVVIGRGCLGRPWLFGDLAAAFAGSQARRLPRLREVTGVMLRHASMLIEIMGADRGIRDFRKHVGWYLKGFSVGGPLRAALSCVDSFSELDERLGALPDEHFPTAILGTPRGRGTGARHVVLPEGWLADPTSRAVPFGAELDASGG
ncbi:MAG: tRNA dihydrouridine synthase DusB [Geodermatophilaceae bacterium]|nr:tRNA dihydrouridine synthase DusB [Geodermatophilaceae bacterium]